jgi:demethylmenaquinone methyltransferase/2-methoxy-6-polyprenyl-1,4-benzoquinol methylase
MVVDKSNQRVRRMFGEIAPRYDLLNHLLSANVDRYWRWRSVRLAPPRGSSPILDVCTGTGDLAFAYQRRASAQTPIVAADFCRRMLEVGIAKRDRRNTHNTMTFLEADTQCLPFEDNIFQLVTVAFGLRNVADTDAGLAEMARVCQPGGRVVVLEFSMPRWQPMRAIYGGYFRYVLPRIGQLMAKNRHEAYHYLPASVGEFDQGQELVERMHTAGLEDVARHPLTFGIATIYIGQKAATPPAHTKAD